VHYDVAKGPTSPIRHQWTSPDFRGFSRTIASGSRGIAIAYSNHPARHDVAKAFDKDERAAPVLCDLERVGVATLRLSA
jgi:hypothetical protein